VTGDYRKKGGQYYVPEPSGRNVEPTTHLDRGNGLEVCRAPDLRHGFPRASRDLREVTCRLCRRIITRALVDGLPVLGWRLRCERCKGPLAYGLDARDVIDGRETFVCLECYNREHPRERMVVGMTDALGMPVEINVRNVRLARDEQEN
jgi:hypothetical protein